MQIESYYFWSDAEDSVLSALLASGAECFSRSKQLRSAFPIKLHSYKNQGFQAMNGLTIMLIALVALAAGYFGYARWLEKTWRRSGLHRALRLRQERRPLDRHDH